VCSLDRLLSADTLKIGLLEIYFLLTSWYPGGLEDLGDDDIALGLGAHFEDYV